jgi:phospholipase C
MVDHVFVVMLENRSFDHMLGLSQIQGTDPSGKPTKIEGLTGKENNLSQIDGQAFDMDDRKRR